MKRIILLTCLTLLMTGCQKENVIPTDKMADILFDIYRFDATVKQMDRFVSNNEKVRYYNGIFDKHGIDKEVFDKSLEWYAAHPEKWRLVYQKLTAKGKDFQSQLLEGTLPELKSYGIALSGIDTLNCWSSMENMYWYKDENQTFDNNRLHQEIEGRKYFIGARKIEFTFRMRCSADSAIDVRTYMVVSNIHDKKPDTLQVKAPTDNKWHRYHLSTGTARKGITNVTVCIADSVTATRLSSIEYENVRLNYIYPKDGEHIDDSDKRILNNIRNRRLNRQDQFNVKRNENGETNSSQPRAFPVLPVSQRND